MLNWVSMARVRLDTEDPLGISFSDFADADITGQWPLLEV
jgi:hypothetical protein